MKGNQRISTFNQLDLQTLGSQPVMPQNLSDHWCGQLNFKKSQQVDMVQGQLDGAFTSLSQSALKSACLLSYEVQSPSLMPRSHQTFRAVLVVNCWGLR